MYRWWQRIERVEELSAFHDAILEELQRHALHRSSGGTRNKRGDDGCDAEAEVDANGSGIALNLTVVHKIPFSVE